MKLLNLLLSSLLFISVTASAQTNLPLFRITSNIFDGEKKVAITVDANNNITQFSYTPQNLIPHYFTVADAGGEKGVVLDQESGKDAVTLTGKGFTADKGGAITLIYLHNGISGGKDSFDFQVLRVGATWEAVAPNDDGVVTKFTEMYLEKNAILGKLIGIKNITVE
jgi:hypothetical protein